MSRNRASAASPHSRKSLRRNFSDSGRRTGNHDDFILHNSADGIGGYKRRPETREPRARKPLELPRRLAFGIYGFGLNTAYAFAALFPNEGAGGATTGCWLGKAASNFVPSTDPNPVQGSQPRPAGNSPFRSS